MKKNVINNLSCRIIFFLLFISIQSTYSYSQNEKQYKIGCIAFYNLENLFDTIVDQDTNKILQDEFTPKGKNTWTSGRYWEKISNMAKVIAEIGTDMSKDGAAIIGVSEIENKAVLEDLVKDPALKDRNYKIIHHESPDRRGIDVGLLYQEKYFKVTDYRGVKLNIPEKPDFRTRDQLVVSGLFDGEEMNIIVTHWPSKRGGEKRSQPLRIAAADLGRQIIDSLSAKNPETKTIYMGDLNDGPFSKSVKDHLNTVGSQDKVKEGLLFNPMENFEKKGIGTSAYRDVWNVIDQLILSPTLVGNDKNTYKFYKAQIFNKPYLIQKEGKYANYPFRTYSFGTYQGGYSDHFPVYIYIIKEI